MLLQAKHVTLVVVFGVNTSKRPCACGYIGCGGFGVGWDVNLHCDCNHIVRSLALPHIRHATLLHVLLHFHTNVMLCCCTFSCTSTHTSCYAAARSLALPHIRHATLLRTSCYAAPRSLALPHIHLATCCTFFCPSTHTSCWLGGRLCTSKVGRLCTSDVGRLCTLLLCDFVIVSL